MDWVMRVLPICLIAAIGIGGATVACSDDNLERDAARSLIGAALPSKVETTRFWLGKLKLRERVVARKGPDGKISLNACPKVAVAEMNSRLAAYPNIISGNQVGLFVRMGLIASVERVGLLGLAKSLLARNPEFMVTCDYAVTLSDKVSPLIVRRQFADKRRRAVLSVKGVTYRRRLKAVTGIVSPSKHIRLVEFDYVDEPTLLGKLLKPGMLGYRNSARRRGRAQFVKYDDGWRLTRFSFR